MTDRVLKGTIFPMKRHDRDIFATVRRFRSAPEGRYWHRRGEHLRRAARQADVEEAFKC